MQDAAAPAVDRGGHLLASSPPIAHAALSTPAEPATVRSEQDPGAAAAISDSLYPNYQDTASLPIQQRPNEQSPVQQGPNEQQAWLASIQSSLLRYPKRSELTLFDAIHAAIEFAPEIEILRAEVEIRQKEITRQQASFDWNHFVATNWDERNVPVGSTLDGAIGRLQNYTFQNSTGVEKRSTLGGQYRLAQDLGFADSNSQFFTPPNQANARLALEFQQPLLQGAGRAVATSRINIARANSNATEEEFMAGLQNHVNGVIVAYWELVQRRGEFIIQQRAFERATHTARILENRSHLDVGPLQLVRAHASLEARRISLVQAEYSVVFAQERLLRLIFGQQFKESVEVELVPLCEVIVPEVQVDIDAEVQISLQNRPEIRRSLQLINRTSIEEGVARNQLLPLLGMTLSLSNQGLRGERALSDAIEDQMDFGDATYGIGLTYSLPVGNRAAKANLRQVNLRMQQLVKQLERSVSDVALEVRNASHNLSLTSQQRETTRYALLLANQELQTLRQRADLLLDGDQVGPLYLDNLLQTQDRLAVAESIFLAAQTGYALAQFELQRANGTLLRSQPMSPSAMSAIP